MKILKRLLFISLILGLFSCEKEQLNNKSLANYEVTISSDLIANIPLRAVLVTDSDGIIYNEKIISRSESGELRIICDAPKDEPVHVTLIELEIEGARNPDFIANTYFDTKSGATFKGDTKIELRPDSIMDVEILGFDFSDIERASTIQIGNGQKSFYKVEIADSIYQFKNVKYFLEESLMIVLEIEDEAFYYIPTGTISPNTPLRIPFSNFKKVNYTHTIKELGGNVRQWFFSPNGSYFVGTDDRNGKVFPIYSNWNRSTYEVSLFVPDNISLSDRHGYLNYGGKKIVELDVFPEAIYFECYNQASLGRTERFPGTAFEFSDPTFSTGTKYFIESRGFLNSNIGGRWNLQGIYKENYFVAIPKISDQLLQTVRSLRALETRDNSAFSQDVSFFQRVTTAQRVIVDFDESELSLNPLLINDLDWMREQKIEICEY